MGSEAFFNLIKGSTASEAFDSVKQEQSNFSHTGTTAGKRTFIEIPLPENFDAREYAEILLESDPRIKNKWDPAGCIKIKPNTYLFFGWVSS